MAKKFPPGICAHCGQYFDELTSDHVFPKSWYPETTPSKLEKWQMPSCNKCNNYYSKIEEDLLIRLSLGLPPDDFCSLGITQRAMRALSPQYGKSKKDKLMRKKKREKILKQCFPAMQFDDKNFIPGFNNRYGEDKNKLFAMIIPADAIEILGEKIIKGIIYNIQNKKILGDEYIVQIFLVDKKTTTYFSRLTEEYIKNYYMGPGISVGVIIAEDNYDCGWFEISIWERIKFYATVMKKSDLKMND